MRQSLINVGPILRTLMLVMIGLCIGNAEAGWIYVNDPDLSDTATNPGHPANQSPSAVGSYLQDLLNLSSAPTLIAANDNYGGATLTGLGDPGPFTTFVLAFHFGNGNDYWPHSGAFDVFFQCASGCDTFALPSTKSVGNYRLYDPPARSTALAVPEPGALLLLVIGLVGLGASRRRKLN